MADKTKLNTPLYSDMAYDDAFRTMETECDDILIPYVNYAFGEKYDSRAKITRLRNEHFVEHDDHSQEKRITDSRFEIEQDGVSKMYHLECESKPYDGSLLIRIFEYDAQSALDIAETDVSALKVRFPHTGLLLLRSRSNTPKKAEIVIDTPEGSVSYDIPIVRVSDFSIDDIFEKKLYMLIPFYIFNYEKDLESINRSEERVEALANVYRDVIRRLEILQSDGLLSSYVFGVIISMTHKVIYKLTMKHTVVHQKVGDVMGGKVLDLPIIRAYHEGQAEGQAEGRAERERLEREIEVLRKEIETLKAKQTNS